MAAEWGDNEVSTDALLDQGERLLADSRRLLHDLERRIHRMQRRLTRPHHDVDHTQEQDA